MAALPDWHGRALLLSKSLIPDISTGLKLKNFSGLCWMCVLSGPVCMCSLSPCHFPCLLLNVLISQSVSFQFLLRAQPSLTLVFFFFFSLRVPAYSVVFLYPQSIAPGIYISIVPLRFHIPWCLPLPSMASSLRSKFCHYSLSELYVRQDEYESLGQPLDILECYNFYFILSGPRDRTGNWATSSLLHCGIVVRASRYITKFPTIFPTILSVAFS